MQIIFCAHSAWSLSRDIISCPTMDGVQKLSKDVAKVALQCPVVSVAKDAQLTERETCFNTILDIAGDICIEATTGTKDMSKIKSMAVDIISQCQQVLLMHPETLEAIRRDREQAGVRRD